MRKKRNDKNPEEDIQDIFARIYQAANCKTQVELAEFLGIKQSSVSLAKRNRSVPTDWLLTLMIKENINPIWVLLGHGEIYLQQTLANWNTEELIAEILKRTCKSLK